MGLQKDTAWVFAGGKNAIMHAIRLGRPAAPKKR